MRVLQYLREMKAVRSFRKNACLGEDIRFEPSARCDNQTGDPRNISIGGHSYIAAHLYVQDCGKIEIGGDFYVGPRTFIGAKEHISIGKCVMISNDVFICDNNNHPTSPKSREYMCRHTFKDEHWSWQYAQSRPVTIEDNVWIGQRAIILKGVRIGSGSIVAAGAVVSRDVPAFSIVAGNPAKVVKAIDAEKDELVF